MKIKKAAASDCFLKAITLFIIPIPKCGNRSLHEYSRL